MCYNGVAARIAAAQPRRPNMAGSAYIRVSTDVTTRLFYGEVVTQQDYEERGPHARSYRTRLVATRAEAEAEARRWCHQPHNSLEIVPGPEAFA